MEYYFIEVLQPTLLAQTILSACPHWNSTGRPSLVGSSFLTEFPNWSANQGTESSEFTQLHSTSCRGCHTHLSDYHRYINSLYLCWRLTVLWCTSTPCSSSWSTEPTVSEINSRWGALQCWTKPVLPLHRTSVSTGVPWIKLFVSSITLCLVREQLQGLASRQSWTMIGSTSLRGNTCPTCCICVVSFYPSRDQAMQKQFYIYWEPGRQNLADLPTKHHTGAHHKQFRPIYTYEKNKSPLSIQECIKLL